MKPSRSGNREFLFKRVTWRVQALAQGGLSERAGRRAEELARATATYALPSHGTPPPARRRRRGRSPAPPPPPNDRLPIPGTVLTRRYRGKHVEVKVLPAGFEHDGQTYRSLSAVAKAVTGGHWNGHPHHLFKGPVDAVVPG